MRQHVTSPALALARLVLASGRSVDLAELRFDVDVRRSAGGLSLASR
ncbi:hypothetical protein STAFG_7812 [Streptomyces afghaniensis 772]|uniref:Uncharacterized protein n=1 Tax=Streptomyces afghaniensis 772 TaxID=1283301 RepID=S4MNV0_9ACTN|nr:hypothetical protein [Streptomyces afghaniensis]EPJ35122.1 hypothetical protein STAFG_7812 [Streptomyces afghaniensis 772]